MAILQPHVQEERKKKKWKLNDRGDRGIIEDIAV